MPILTQSVQSNVQADGSFNVILRMWDQDATEYLQTFNAPAGFDIAGKVAIVVAELNEQLAANEFVAVVGL